MKKCKKCNEEHDGSYGSGIFCSPSCARSFSMINDDKNETKKAICVICGKETDINKRASIKTAKCEECNPKIKQKKQKKQKPIKYCLNCNNIVTNYKSIFCCVQCHKDYEYKEYIKKWKDGKVDGLKCHGNSTSNHVRRYLLEKYDGKCSRCGWNTPNPFIKKVILEIEYIDGDSTNGDEDNLDLICPNCHSLTSTYKALNKGNGNRNRLKYFKLI